MLALEPSQTKQVISRLVKQTQQLSAQALSLLSKKAESRDRARTSLIEWAEGLAPEIISRVTQSVIDYGNYFSTASNALFGIDIDALERTGPDDKQRRTLAAVVGSLADRAVRHEGVVERLLARCKVMSERIDSAIELKAIAADLSDMASRWRALKERILSVAETLENTATETGAIYELSDFEIQRGRRACRELSDFASTIQAASISDQMEQKL